MVINFRQFSKFKIVGRVLTKMISPDRLVYSPISQFSFPPPIDSRLFQVTSRNGNDVTNNDSKDVKMINKLALDSLVELFKVLRRDSHPISSFHHPVRKSKSFCAYRGCINKIRMKKSQSDPSKKVIDKLLGFLKERMAHLKQIPDLDGKRQILQVILCFNVYFENQQI